MVTTNTRRKRLLNICLALLLYLVQGIAIGLTISIPLFLIYYGATWNDRGTFNFATYPFSLKLLWAPLVDVLYMDRFGRRKSWIIPIQLIMAVILLTLSFYIESLVMNNHVVLLTVIFFLIMFLTATQDISIDGLAISWFASTNPQWTSTSQTIGQGLGRLIGSSFLMTFESANFTNRYIRTPLSIPSQTFGLFSLEQFVRWVAVTFLIITILLILFVREKKETIFSLDKELHRLSLVDTYLSVIRLCKKNCIQQLIVASLLSPIAFVATQYMIPLALISQGVSRDNLAIVNIPVTLVTIMTPLLISDTKKPLVWFTRIYVFHLINAIFIAIYVYLTPKIIVTSYYYPLLFLILALNEFIKSLISAAYVGFYASITDPYIGGTYMTFLSTISNLGFALNSSLILYVADWLPKKYTYVIATGICNLLGILWFILSYQTLKRLQTLPVHQWHLKKVMTPCHTIMLDENKEDIDYDDDPNVKDPTLVLKHQKLKTRLYVVLLAVCLYMLLYVTLVKTELKTIGVSEITPDLFKNLSFEHGQSLSCPCKTIAIPYKTVLFNNVTMHSVCSSVFVDPEWIERLYFANASLYGVWDFRTTAFSQFKILSKFCSLSNEIISEVKTNLDNTDLVTIELLSETQFQQELNGIIEIQKSNALSRIISFLDYLRTTIQGNYLVTGLGTNWLVEVVYMNDTSDGTVGSSVKYYTPPFGYLSCSSKNVIIPATLSALPLAPISYTRRSTMRPLPNATIVKGFYTGCTPLGALLNSTLDCLYDMECLQLLWLYFPNLSQITKTIYHWNNSILLSKYENLTVLDYFNILFIDDWSVNMNYSRYFNQCYPSMCTYTIEDRVAVSYAVAIFISLYGGLIVLLRFVASSLIDTWLKLQDRNPSKPIQSLKRLNLFKNIHHRTESNIQQQRITTRIYLILLFGSLCFVCLYMTLSNEIVIITISNPSIITYKTLESRYSTTLQCPCSNQTISHRIFMSFSPILHQFCSSGFVDDDWIALLQYSAGDIVMNDWRNQAHQHFQTLSDFCQLANKTITAAIHRFLSQIFITSSLINEFNFNEQLNASIDQFYQSTLYNFDLVKDVIHLIMQVDQYYLGSLKTTLRNYETGQIVNTIINETNNVRTGQVQFIPHGIRELNLTSFKCNCFIDPSCQNQAVIYDSTFNTWWANDINLIYNVSGWIQGCLSIDSLQFSTLECLYIDSDCFPLVLSYLLIESYFLTHRQASNRMKPLVYDPSSSRFPPKTPISIIVKELMVDQWNPSSSYESFYYACAPVYCAFPQRTHKESLMGLIITLVSMIGSIVVSLRLLTPHLVKFMLELLASFKKKSDRNIPIARNNRLKTMLIKIKKLLHTKLIQLNIFTLRDFDSKIDRITAKRFGQWATRLYILLFTTIIIVLIFYTMIRSNTLTKQFDQPSFIDYNHLQKVYGDQLKCRCSKIAFPYDRFVYIEPIFHSVCKSIFISEEWRLALVTGMDSNSIIYEQHDYRQFLSAHLQYLQGLCRLSIQSMNNSINEFVTSLLVTVELLSEMNFHNRVNMFVEQTKVTAPITFFRLLSSTGNLFHGNALISIYGKNFEYKVLVDGARYRYAYTEPMIYDNGCSCGLSLNCTIQGSFIERSSSRNISIKGIRMGCTPTQTFFASTLECFYDQSCLDLIQNYTNYHQPLIPLSINNLTYFSQETTLTELVNNLFIQQWSVQIDYASYYQQCLPSICSYTSIEKFNIFHTITVILGIQAGLTIVLKWICPKLVSIGSEIHSHRKKRVTPVQHTTDPNQLASPITTQNTTWNKKIYWIALFIGIMVGISFFSVYHLRQNQIIDSTTTVRGEINDGYTSSTITSDVFPSLCHPIFEEVSIAVPCEIYSPGASFIADVNADYFVDLIFPCQYNETINILLGAANHTFQQRIIINFEVYSWIYHIRVHDMNNDGQVDLILTHFEEITILFGYGNGTFHTSNMQSLSIAGFPQLIYIVDLNHDRRLDIVITIQFKNDVFIYFANNNGSFSLGLTLFTTHFSDLTGLIVIDFNNDTYLDIAVMNRNSFHIHVFYANAYGRYQPQKWFFTAIDAIYIGLVAGDFNSDNRIDIAVFRGWKHLVSMLFINKNETFHVHEQIMMESSIALSSVVACDLNSDQYLDVMIGTNAQDGMYSLLGNGNGEFQIQTIHPNYRYTIETWNEVTDLNNDRCQDIITIDIYGDYINILLNKCNCLTY